MEAIDNTTLTSITEILTKELPAAYAEKRVDKLITKLSQQFGISKTTINVKLVKPLGLKPPPKRIINATHDNIPFDKKYEIYDFYIKYDKPDATGATSKRFNKSESTIGRIVKSLTDDGFAKKDNSNSYRDYSLNQTFFDDINSEEKAYILGLIATDGNVFGNKLSIELKRTDKDLLYKVAKALTSNRPIADTLHYDKKTGNIYEASKFEVQSKYMIIALQKYGIVENKSLTLDMDLSQIPTTWISHFWRGMIDGDGWVVQSKPCKDVITSDTVGLCGTLLMMKKYLAEIKSRFNYESSPVERTEVFQVIFYGEKCRAITDWLYENSKIYLDRKYQNYLAMKIAHPLNSKPANPSPPGPGPI